MTTIPLCDPDAEPDAPVLPLEGPVLPLHAISTSGARRRRGRPPTVIPAPQVSQIEYEARLAAARSAAVEADPIVAGLDSHRLGGTDLLWAVLDGMAREQAAMAFDLSATTSNSREPERVRSRRVECLRSMLNVLMGIRGLGSSLDLRGQTMTRVFELFLGEVREAAHATLAPDVAELLMVRLKAALHDWPDKVGA